MRVAPTAPLTDERRQTREWWARGRFLPARSCSAPESFCLPRRDVPRRNDGGNCKIYPYRIRVGQIVEAEYPPMAEHAVRSSRPRDQSHHRIRSGPFRGRKER